MILLIIDCSLIQFMPVGAQCLRPDPQSQRFWCVTQEQN